MATKEAEPFQPVALDSRFEIRRLESSQHRDWAKAILLHTNIFHSPVWSIIYPDKQFDKISQGWEAMKYLVDLQIDSGWSFGVFDREYKFKRPESAATGGKLYWDLTNAGASAADLLEQMDFPLVSIALSYDGINPPEPAKLGPLIGLIPAFGTLYMELAARDSRDPTSWKARKAGEVLMRNGTSTRADYEGNGVMKKAAWWLMREAARKGFTAIQIECVHDAVTHVWSHPPEPFKADVVASFDSKTLEYEDADGNKTKPFYPAKQVVSAIYVRL
ncbi:hypothetical protein P152DRAFT_454772 [Eremomyces bilateralis CBS 781.70]|uniref:N-acetyltransferase domain-containing protein n=1 Tax=Eremomyces bilateralis CBS 781.70 TaxID=1392243 RepID=A0A6G1GEH4_9PEZI|nr:uncharacterized protein P152DRAFT_454772 [Eremomyces bilateralis CBS 781.70]KAF1816515.1 hypothetical protein P152DRAFT_454772 [Eremomyces bilateralis CBS 781.70]